jgi:hypothetical protein
MDTLLLVATLPLCILLAHYFPPSITINRTHKLIEEPRPAPIIPIEGEAKVEQVPPISMFDIVDKLNETFHELGGDHEG